MITYRLSFEHNATNLTHTPVPTPRATVVLWGLVSLDCASAAVAKSASKLAQQYYVIQRGNLSIYCVLYEHRGGFVFVIRATVDQ